MVILAALFADHITARDFPASYLGQLNILGAVPQCRSPNRLRAFARRQNPLPVRCHCHKAQPRRESERAIAVCSADEPHELAVLYPPDGNRGAGFRPDDQAVTIRSERQVIRAVGKAIEPRPRDRARHR